MNISHLLTALLAFSSTVGLSRGETSVSAATNQFAITFISVAGTNLVLHAAKPSGIEQVTLEICLSLNGAWQEQGQLSVQTGLDQLAFTIPKPTNAMAFFRLKGKTRESAALLSDQVRYVITPSLESNRGTNGEAIFHFKGRVDGSDKILITRDGALWSHMHWDWPAVAVTINGASWAPDEKNFLTTPGQSRFLPEPFSLDSARLEVIQARDVVALERETNALIVYLNDTPVGSDEYEFAIHFERERPKSQKVGGTPARIKLAARIDGSDRIKITQKEASWELKTWSDPLDVTLNSLRWSPEETPILTNGGDHIFLPDGVEFSTARIVARKGRDLATMWAEKNAVWIWFADNPNGDDLYELEIAFGQ